MITQSVGINKVLMEQKETPHLLVQCTLNRERGARDNEQDKRPSQINFNPLIQNPKPKLYVYKERFLLPLFSRRFSEFLGTFFVASRILQAMAILSNDARLNE